MYQSTAIGCSKNGGSILVSETAFLTAANVTDTHLEVELSDGRRIITPLSWYPRLQYAERSVLQDVEVYSWGLHWPELDEDLSLEGMLSGVSGTAVSSKADERVSLAVAPRGEINLADVGFQNGVIDFPDLSTERRDG